MGNYHQKRVRVNYHYFVVTENGYIPSMLNSEHLVSFSGIPNVPILTPRSESILPSYILIVNYSSAVSYNYFVQERDTLHQRVSRISGSYHHYYFDILYHDINIFEHDYTYTLSTAFISNIEFLVLPIAHNYKIQIRKRRS